MNRRVYNIHSLKTGAVSVRVFVHQGGLSIRWSLIKVIFHQGGCLSLEWSFVGVVCHQAGFSLGVACTVLSFSVIIIFILLSCDSQSQCLCCEWIQSPLLHPSALHQPGENYIGGEQLAHTQFCAHCWSEWQRNHHNNNNNNAPCLWKSLSALQINTLQTPTTNSKAQKRKKKRKRKRKKRSNFVVHLLRTVLTLI